MKTYSPSQIKIFQEIKDANTNIAVLATAGSGKTTTIVEALNYVPKVKRTIFLSFAKAIVEELKSRVPSHVTASTLHSLGFKLVSDWIGHKHLKVNKYGKYFQAAIKYIEVENNHKALDKKQFRMAKIVQDVCDYARMTLTTNTIEDLQKLSNYYSLEADPHMIEIASKLLQTSTKISFKHPDIDFIDMIYLPAVVPGIASVQYDYIFLDEAQDLNKAQFQFLELILAPQGRLIAVGDDYQCIYGFAGADIDSFKRIRERGNTVTLPLTVSYRVPKSIVQKARTVNEQIEAHEDSEEGIVRDGHWEEIKEGDMVLSRTTKPLIALYFRLIDNNIKAKIYGKDIEKGLIDLAKACMSDSKEGFMYQLELQFEELKDELRKKGVSKIEEHPLWRGLQEKQQMFGILLQKVQQPKDLIDLIQVMFNEHSKTPVARLMTIHRAKGLECDRVFVIHTVDGQPIMPSKWAVHDWEHIQERNLMFVAFTRSKKELIMIVFNN